MTMMIARTLIYYFLLPIAMSPMSQCQEVVPNKYRSLRTCLLGYMTEWQSWVDENGKLTNKTIATTIDVSSLKNPTSALQKEMSNINRPDSVKRLSLAKCGLRRVPQVFHLTDSRNRNLSDTLVYLTFYGNTFSGYYSTWTSGFHSINFESLRELDLRKCSIKVLDDYTFKGMSKLEALYLGENKIHEVDALGFYGLWSLKHLDLNSNTEEQFDDRMVIDEAAFTGLKNIEFLDLSFTKLDRRCLSALDDLGKQLKMLSLCRSSLTKLEPEIFKNTSIAYLDVSANPGILEEPKTLEGLQNSLRVIFACGTGLRELEIFVGFDKLEILRARENELAFIPQKVASSLKSLQVLDLDRNRMQTWVEPVIKRMPNLKFLSLRENNLNLISLEMMNCFSNLTYLAISGNNIVCNCNSRELFEIAYRNEKKALEYLPIATRFEENNTYANRGFNYYNEMLSTRRQTTKKCGSNKGSCEAKQRDLESDGKYILLDYDTDAYKCLSSEGETETFLESPTCKVARNLDFGELHQGWAELWALIIIPIIVFPTLIFLFVFRKNLRYFCVMMKNTATLSLINASEFVDDGTIYNYDVFVSYCNDDRDWVLDHLLPHLEQDCNVRVCLHERDFQVGLSILENIVSCMDRSSSIMLVLSKKFLLSQWCQFEMHLAQHRLLETRREDLILILLEDIPRRLRPTTLHYLMLTKTYVVWPVDLLLQEQFWRRLKRSLLARRLVHSDNVSLA